MKTRFILLYIVLVLGGAGCREAPVPTPSVEEGPAYAMADAIAGPVVFAPGLVTTEAEEYRITFSPDGRTAYFGRSAVFFPFSREAAILVTRYEGGAWSEPAPASFSGQYADLDPCFSPDGTRLFFSSARPISGKPREDFDLWMVERTEVGWGAPIHLGTSVNSPADELYPSVAADGTLYFGSDRTEDWDIYRAQRDAAGAYGTPEALGPAVNTDAWEFNPAISSDGKTLVFTSLNRPEGHGLGDLYVSHWEADQWRPARNLGSPINTAADEFHAGFSPDEAYLFFIRRPDVPESQGDVYQVRW